VFVIAVFVMMVPMLAVVVIVIIGGLACPGSGESVGGHRISAAT